MRILTRTQYDAIVDIVTGQKRIIDQKEEVIQRLKKQKLWLKLVVSTFAKVPTCLPQMKLWHTSWQTT